MRVRTGRVKFDSQPVGWLFRLIFFVVFLSFSMKMLGWYFKIDKDPFLHILLKCVMSP
jgi:hypothetical protein